MQEVPCIHRSVSTIVKRSSFSTVENNPKDEVSRSLRRLSSLPADFCCSICMNIFSKPSMLSCGHSFCSKCIQYWLSENFSCPTCRTDTHTPIRNIALEQVVEEFKISQGCRMIRCSRPTNIRNENGHASLFRRQMLRASRRRARFSVTGPEIIVDGPGSSLEALPTTSRENSYRSLSSLPQVDNSASRDDRMDPTVAIRRRSSRNSHDSWSGRMGQLYSVHDSENHDTASTTGFKRTSFLRRSICAIRKSVRRRPQKRDIASRSLTAMDNPGFVEDEPEPSITVEPTVTAVPIEEVAKTKKSKWKRLFPFRIKKVHPSREHGRNEVSSYGPLCVYSGFGRTFERINSGEEIAIAVFGRRGVGKTSFLDNATLSCEGRHGIAPMGLTERMRLGGKQNHNEYRFAHMTSVTVQARHQRFVIDLIDAEFEDDHSIAHTSYMRAADAAILLYSTTDSASLLMAMSIHRQLVAVSEQRKPCVLFANVIEDAAQRYVTREMGERTARNIRAMYIEANLLAQDGGVFAAVEHLCRAVVSNRKNSDGNHICTVM
ncbi:hypothetical protein RB195_003543 [Necator americanus]|uniref:RING-type domain-containing protein n=1 Tax=Necator americanus TaxID=51031 RepID=A0ABR1DP25_NECAM